VAERVSVNSPLKDKVFSTFLGQNPGFEPTARNGITAPAKPCTANCLSSTISGIKATSERQNCRRAAQLNRRPALGESDGGLVQLCSPTALMMSFPRFSPAYSMAMDAGAASMPFRDIPPDI